MGRRGVLRALWHDPRVRRRAFIFLPLAVLALAALAALGFFVFWRRSGLPQRSGTARIAGLTAPVDVRFDEWGVPHVRASNVRDLAAALGWLHANDRMTQLELGRRASSGRLAEILGAELVGADRSLRELRLRKSAQRMWDAMGPESRALLESYAAGVNAWLEERGSDLPPELRALGVEPEPWTPADSLGFTMLMARDLSFPVYSEERRFRWLGALGLERTRELVGDPALEVAPGILELAQASSRGRTPELTGSAPAPPRNGSNDWAVGASRSKTGSPLVANDPHLDLGLPNTWYQAQLRAPDYEAAGMTLPGSPLVVVGQGRDVAWAVTNTELDTNDLFFEQLDESGTQARRGGGWVPIESELEAIRVRGGDAVEITLRSIEGRPLLEAETELGLPPRTLAWTAYEPFDPVAPFLGLARARDVREAAKTVADFVCPVENLIVAARDGGMLFTLLGRVPERGRGDGRLPSPAWDPAYAWKGLRPAETNPRAVDPPEELLVTANDDIRPPGYALPLAADFALPHRAQRIRELLAAEETFAPEDFARLQLDVRSLYARELVANLPGDLEGDAQLAWRALEAWSGSFASRGPAALFALFERELFRAVFEDEFAAHALGGLGLVGHDRGLLGVLSGRFDPVWFDDVRTPASETRRDVVARALERAWREGRERFGEDVASWDYGSMHVLELEHALGGMPVVGALFDRGPFELPGSGTCVNAFSGPWRGETIQVTHGPSMRWVADAEDPDRSLAVLPGGQSGHPFDAHYDDQLEEYLAGRMHTVRWSQRAVDSGAVSTLALLP